MNTKIALHETTINSFTTADGGIIDFVDGYYEAYNRKRSEYVADNVFVANIKSDRDKLHSAILVQRLHQGCQLFSLMRDALFSLSLKNPRARGLDVGGAEGAEARLMRGSGLVNWVACND